MWSLCFIHIVAKNKNRQGTELMPSLPFLAFRLYTMNSLTLLLIDKVDIGIVGDCDV